MGVPPYYESASLPAVPGGNRFIPLPDRALFVIRLTVATVKLTVDPLEDKEFARRHFGHGVSDRSGQGGAGGRA